MGKRVAVVGLGRMGAGVAASILRSGVELTVWIRTPRKCEALRAMGASVASTPKEAAAGADIILTSLMDDEFILDVLQGEQGVLSGLRRGDAHACLTTISPAFANSLADMHAAAGSRYVSAPVLGRPDAAAKGQLISMLSGDTEAVERDRGRLDLQPGRASCRGPRRRRKQLEAVLELHRRLSDRNDWRSIRSRGGERRRSFAAERILSGHVRSPGSQALCQQDLQPRLPIRRRLQPPGGIKDVTLMLDAARQNRVELDLGRLVLDKIQIALKRGLAESDWSVLTEASRGAERPT